MQRIIKIVTKNNKEMHCLNYCLERTTESNRYRTLLHVNASEITSISSIEVQFKKARKKLLCMQNQLRRLSFFFLLALISIILYINAIGR